MQGQGRLNKINYEGVKELFIKNNATLVRTDVNL